MTKEMENRIFDELRQMITERDAVNREQSWIVNHLEEPKLSAMVPKTSIVGLHILSALKQQDMTGIELAQTLNVTRGGVTRAAKTLLKLVLITSYKQSTNQKNVYYKLTENGRTIADTHDEMHATLEAQRLKVIREKYNDDDLALIGNFLHDMLLAEREFK